MEDERDISDIPCDVLHIIRGKTEADHYFRQVCRSWFSVVDRSNRSKGLHPWLFLPQSTGDEMKQKFYNIMKDRIEQMNWPQEADSYYWGSQFGCVVAVHDHSAELFTPLNTEHHYPLPSLSPLELGDVGRLRFVLSGSSASPPHALGVTIISPDGWLGFSKPGDDEWNVIKIQGSAVADIILIHDRFYFVNTEGFLDYLNVDDYSQSGANLSLPPQGLSSDDLNLEDIEIHQETPKRFYLVELMGEMHLVVRYQGYDYENLSTFDHHQSYIFKVFKFNLDTQNWTELSTLGDYAIFVGNNTSFSFPVSDHPQCKASSIYFTEHWLGDELYNGKPGVFNLATKELSSFQTVDQDEDIVLICPPVWFMPKFL